MVQSSNFYFLNFFVIKVAILTMEIPVHGWTDDNVTVVSSLVCWGFFLFVDITAFGLGCQGLSALRSLLSLKNKKIFQESVVIVFYFGVL